MRSCVVVFPLYKAPDKTELAFLENGLARTKGYKQVIVAPEGLIVDKKFGQLQQLEVKRFARSYFEDIKGYNQLLLSKAFYNAFALFDFMLIHQADVYLFKDELGFWCEKKYDYIGAPWFKPDKLNKGILYNIWEQLKLSCKPNKVYAQRYNKVGNGGLSLRKIGSALMVLDQVDQALLDKYLQTQGDRYNEDVFWSLEAPKIMNNYRIPDWQKAMQFAVEFHPAIAFDYLKEELPFGCHAPLKHNPEFWKKYIPKLNLDA